MNKKLFTLAAALMLGSAFTVNAQEAITAGSTTKLSTSTYYFIGTGSTFMKGYAVTDGTGAKKYTTIGSAPSSDLNGAGKVTTDLKNYLWKISYQEVNGDLLISLTNKETGKLLGFDANGDPTTDPTLVKTTAFTWSGVTLVDGNLIYANANSKIAVNGTKKIGVGGTTWTTGTTGSNVKLFAETSANVTAGYLNNQLGNGFSFSFVDLKTQPADNIFGQKLYAFQLTSTMNSQWGGTTYAEGTYFALTPLPADIALTDYADVKNWFLTTQFVAVSPVEHLGIPALEQKDGTGFKLVTVLGKDLKQGGATKTAVASANAAFKVIKPAPENEPGNFTLSVTPYVKLDASKDDQSNAKGEMNIILSKVMGENYVTTGTTTAAKVKLGDVNMVAVKDLLKKDGASVFNILFVSGAEDQAAGIPSEYGKYLGMMNDITYDNGTPLFTSDDYVVNLLAQGPAFVNLKSAELQWVISDADADNKTFTFKNRENGATFTTGLRQTDKANVYEISSGVKFEVASIENSKYEKTPGFNLIGKTIELQPTAVDKMAGYANYSNEELNQLVKLQFEVGSKVLSKNIYVKAKENYSGSTLSYISIEPSQNMADAAQWELIKRTGISDSIYSEMNYAYLDKDGKVQKDGEIENHEIVTYSLKLYRDGDAYYYNAAGTLEKTNKLILAPRFAIKENVDGTIALIKVNTTDYNNFTKEGLGINGTTGALEYHESAYLLPNEKSYLYLGTEISTPSLEAVSRHASFQSVNGGFLGVGAEGDAIVAATKDEAQELTFWLDTTDVEKYTPSFYISQGIKAETKADAAEVRNFLFNAKDSVSYYDAGTASTKIDWNYLLNSGETKAIFKAGTLVNKDSLNTIVAGKEVGLNNANGLKNFKFNIVLADADVADEYVIKSVADNNYVANINGKVALVNDPYTAMVVTLGEGDATANEAIAAEGVQVIGGQGVVTVQGAAGKVVTVANILGQTIANQVAASDNVTIAVPAGIVVVAVDGEATKVVVK